MKYQTYIFDLDGTLLNTLTDLAASCNYALRAHDMPERSLDEVRMFVGNGVRKLMERAVPSGVAQQPAFDDVLNTFREHYLAHGLDHTAPYPGIPELLRELKQRGCQVAVVSNKFHAATQELCAHFFGSLIDVAVGESPQVRKKPAPDMVLKAIHELHADPLRSVYIGDSDVDISTAKACQLPCISVLWGFRDQDFLTQSGATHFARVPKDILNIEH